MQRERHSRGIQVVGNVNQGSPIVVEHRWDVLSRKCVCRVGDKQTGLTHRTISHHDALDVLHGRCCHCSSCCRRRPTPCASQWELPATAAAAVLSGGADFLFGRCVGCRVPLKERQSCCAFAWVSPPCLRVRDSQDQARARSCSLSRSCVSPKPPVGISQTRSLQQSPYPARRQAPLPKRETQPGRRVYRAGAD